MDEATAVQQPRLLDPAARPPADEGLVPVRRPRRRPRWPGRTAFGAGVLTPITVALGILTATDGAFLVGTVLAYVGIGTSGIAVVLGLVAAAGRWGRGAGVAGLVLGLLANPLVLLYGLELLGGRR